MIKTPEMELALASWFDYRVNLIVPNVHWGRNMHECDLLMISKAGYATEIEIKISRADLRRDMKKWHRHHGGHQIKYLYFAMPAELEASAELVPAHAGIILIRSDEGLDYERAPRCRQLRPAVVNKGANKMSDRDQYKVARLGALRIWNLKRKLNGG